MAIRTKDTTRKPVIDLAGPQGNAFCLLGYAGDFGKQLGWDATKIEQVRAEMKSGDYENLIQVFDEHFGDYVDLER